MGKFFNFFERKNKMLEFNKLKENDKEIYDAVMSELSRQQNKIELIASEN